MSNTCEKFCPDCEVEFEVFTQASVFLPVEYCPFCAYQFEIAADRYEAEEEYETEELEELDFE